MRPAPVPVSSPGPVTTTLHRAGARAGVRPRPVPVSGSRPRPVRAATATMLILFLVDAAGPVLLQGRPVFSLALPLRLLSAGTGRQVVMTPLPTVAVGAVGPGRPVHLGRSSGTVSLARRPAKDLGYRTGRVTQRGVTRTGSGRHGSSILIVDVVVVSGRRAVQRPALSGISYRLKGCRPVGRALPHRRQRRSPLRTRR